ncbi:TniQ family protein [Methylovorus sp. SPW-M1]
MYLRTTTQVALLNMADRHKVLSQWHELQAKLAQRDKSWEIENYRMLGLPDILPGEVFSSWVWRVQTSGGLSNKYLKERWKLKYSPWQLDYKKNAIDFERISKSLTNVPVELLVDTTLNSFTGLNESQVVCLFADPLNTRPIYRYCPECLIADATPYIRKTWRYAFSYVCTQHHRILEERCPNCHQFVDLSKSGKFGKHAGIRASIRVCGECGHDLGNITRQVEPRMLEILILAQRRLFDEIGTFNAEEALMRFCHYDGIAMHPLWVGLHGRHVFMMENERVASFAMKHKLYANTYWYSQRSIVTQNLKKLIRSNKRSGF